MAKKKRETLTVERIPLQFQLDPTSDFESGRFAGVASVFDSVVDTFPNRTRIKKGSFLRTINSHGNRVKILMQHDQGSIWIGLPVKLQETDEGLFVEASLNNTQLGKDAAEALRHAVALGKLDSVEMSIGFDAMNFEMNEGEDEEVFRDVTEIRLWEISLVNFGADRKTKMMEAARLDMEHGLLPRHRQEALALAIAQHIDSLVEMDESPEEHSKLSPTARRILENAQPGYQTLLEVQEDGPTEESPTNEPTIDELETELAEAEELCLELIGAIQDD